MNSYTLTNATLLTPIGTTARRGSAMNDLYCLDRASVEVHDGVITYVGSHRGTQESKESIDLKGKLLLPGLVDSHTHLPFMGNRADEFTRRLRGESYLSIMQTGGGIASTMRTTRMATAAEMCQRMNEELPQLFAMGITTVECKSGYGLDKTTELKQLEAIRMYNHARGSDQCAAVPTFLGAHALPPEYAGRADAYIDFLIEEMLPLVKDGLSEICDIFCEQGAFTVEQSRKLLLAARAQGFRLKIHADELTCTGSSQLAAELGALSADHLLHASDEGIGALAQANTVATLLPLTAFSLNEPFARGREMIDAGCAVALATDYNPGSCSTYSIPLLIFLACSRMRLTVFETITALTLNGAAALGQADRIGSIEVGKQADLVAYRTDNYNDLPYCIGLNLVDRVWKATPTSNNNPLKESIIC